MWWGQGRQSRWDAGDGRSPRPVCVTRTEMSPEGYSKTRKCRLWEGDRGGVGRSAPSGGGGS